MLTGEGGSGQVNVTAMALAPAAAGESFPPFFGHNIPHPVAVSLSSKSTVYFQINLPLHYRWLEGWVKE